MRPTTLPWGLSQDRHENDSDDTYIWSTNGDCVGQCWNGQEECDNKKQADANAKFIIKACNSHYQLLKSIKALVKEYDCKNEKLPAYYQALDAIKLAKGKEK